MRGGEEMDSTIISAALALIGSLVGTFGGIVTTNKLTSYRIQQLEKKVDKHNNLIDRMYIVEDKINLHNEQIKVANHRIDDLERK